MNRWFIYVNNYIIYFSSCFKDAQFCTLVHCNDVIDEIITVANNVLLNSETNNQNVRAKSIVRFNYSP